MLVVTAALYKDPWLIPRWPKSLTLLPTSIWPTFFLGFNFLPILLAHFPWPRTAPTPLTLSMRLQSHVIRQRCQCLIRQVTCVQQGRCLGPGDSNMGGTTSN